VMCMVLCGSCLWVVYCWFIWYALGKVNCLGSAIVPIIYKLCWRMCVCAVGVLVYSALLIYFAVSVAHLP
jgi:hypothetical protein